MDLISYLEQNDLGLHRSVMTVRDKVQHILERPVHPHYTDHSLKHSERVIKNLDGLTQELMRLDGHLSPTEVYILLAAAYLHDIGMQDERRTTDMPAQRYAPDIEWIREHHHELTREMIFEYLGRRGNFVELGLPRIPVIDEMVAWVAEAHRQVDLLHERFNSFSHGTETIRPRLLAALLRFADELDIDHQRVYMDRLKLMKAPFDSYLHWYLCHYVEAVQIENEYITIWYRFPEGHSHYEQLIEPLVERKIREACEQLEDVFRRSGVKPAINRHSEKKYSRLIEPLPHEVEDIARAKYNRWHQDEIERHTREMLPQQPNLFSKIVSIVSEWR